MSEIINTSNFSLDFSSSQFYNTGCIDELDKLSKLCSDFRVNVADTMNDKVYLAFILMIIFIVLMFVLRYGFDKYKDYTWFIFVIKRIDWILLCISICSIALLFI
jgi:hypothetical protein